jgi:hypothetical protein
MRIFGAKYTYIFIPFTLCFLMYFELIESYFYEFDMPRRLCELIAKINEFLHFIFQTLLLVTGASPRYNFRIETWDETKLKYTYQAFQEGIIGINSSLFGPLIRLAKLG